MKNILIALILMSCNSPSSGTVSADTKTPGTAPLPSVPSEPAITGPKLYLIGPEATRLQYELTGVTVVDLQQGETSEEYLSGAILAEVELTADDYVLVVGVYNEPRVFGNDQDKIDEHAARLEMLRNKASMAGSTIKVVGMPASMDLVVDATARSLFWNAAAWNYDLDTTYSDLVVIDWNDFNGDIYEQNEIDLTAEAKQFIVDQLN